ncbi:glycosyltransferase family 2 protein [Opitutales bacterium ASA1]|uniref:glycosyltransferase family 2 protein n=1 Tax=Congregicoccus parvus TaxID=3081749 RepID=UPI002B3147C6|nr:glycosyltransferase family 2 protein [Opitutales bacterium ASA1]
MPAHNEAAGIETAIRTVRGILDAAGLRHEIIVVDDGSRDGTFDRVAAAAQSMSDVVGIRLSRNFGKEAAILAGLRATRGEVVVTMDSDLQHPPTMIPAMVEEWRRGAMVVNAVKRERAVDTVAARARAMIYGWLSKQLGGLDLRNSSDFKLLDKRVVEVVIDLLPERHRLYRGLVQWVGYKQAELLFDVDERVAGETKFSVRALLALAITGVISFTHTPLRIITGLGVLTLLLSVWVAADAVWTWYHGTAVSGFATTIIVELTIGSFIMISLGIVGEYIAKMYDELKRRPTYLVSTRVGPPPGREDPRRPL